MNTDIYKNEGKHPVPCSFCGRTINKHLWQIKKNKNNFCSPKCWSEYRKEWARGKFIGEKNPQYRGGKISINCFICGKLTLICQSRFKKYMHHFCSPSCYYEWRRGYSRKFKEKISWKYNCEICGKEYEPQHTHKNRNHKHHVCSFECYAILRSKTYFGENHYNWQGGKSYEPYSKDFAPHLKEFIRNRDYRQCKMCGKIEDNGKLDVHHIDYDKNNCHPDNLISLCHDCHVKTNYNREYWIEYFQKFMTNRLESFQPTLPLAVNQ